MTSEKLAEDVTLNMEDGEEDQNEGLNIDFEYDEAYSERLDVYLSKNVEGLSRSYIQKLIKEGRVEVNGSQNAVKKHLLKLGDVVRLQMPKPEKLAAEPENIPIEIIYEDEQLIIVNKPQGMVVHPAPGNYTGTLVNALLYHCEDKLSTINGVIRPGIVHRIDKDTSGLLMIAKTDLAHRALADELKAYKSERIYYALVVGRFKEIKGTIKTKMARSSVNRLKMAVSREGREAITHYEVLRDYGNYSLVKCQLETGRTHQIRVHMQHIGHSIVGDPLYGPQNCKLKHEGQLLHAASLGLTHPTTGKFMRFEVPLPDYFEKILKTLEGANSSGL